MLTKVKPINPRSKQFHLRADMQKISQNIKQLYHPFDLFQLSISRLVKINAFEQLIDQLKSFNDQISKWKNNKHQITNITMTYHLYQNLFARLRYICYFSTEQTKAEEQIRRIRSWFFAEKPLIRCQVIEVKPHIKNKPLPQKQPRASSLPADLLNQQLQPFKKKLRTAHKGFFPPKESLKQFKRKQFLVLDNEQEEKNLKKNISTSTLYKMKMSNYRNSITSVTRSTFKETKDTFKNTGLEFKIQQIGKQQKKQQKQQKQEQIKEGQKQQKKVQNEQRIQQKKQNQEQGQKQQKNQNQQIQQIKENLEQFEQEQDEEQQEQQKTKQLKVFVSDHDIYDKMVAQDMGRVSYEASLRQYKKHNQNKVRSNMDQISMKRNMVDWAKGSSKVHKLQNTKLQMVKKCNKFQKLQHKASQHSNKIFSSSAGFKKQPKVVQVLHRNKSSTTVSLQKDIQKARMKETMKNWGKYINHVGSDHFQPLDEYQQKNIKQLRSTSLTAFADNGKKISLEDILDENSPDVFNERVQNQLIELKTNLAGKGVSLDKKKLFQSLSIVPLQQTAQIKKAQNVYKQSNHLLSNPFFPKHLYQTKKKKRNDFYNNFKISYITTCEDLILLNLRLQLFSLNLQQYIRKQPFLQHLNPYHQHSLLTLYLQLNDDI